MELVASTVPLEPNGTVVIIAVLPGAVCTLRFCAVTIIYAFVFTAVVFLGVVLVLVDDTDVVVTVGAVVTTVVVTGSGCPANTARVFGPTVPVTGVMKLSNWEFFYCCFSSRTKVDGFIAQ